VRGWKRLSSWVFRSDTACFLRMYTTCVKPILFVSAPIERPVTYFASSFATASSIIGTYRSSAHGTVSGLMIDDPVTKD
jgi:hypothetical protein